MDDLLDISQKWQISDDQISTQLGEETVLLQKENGTYYSLNAMGTEVWAMLQNEAQSISTLCDRICAEYEVEKSECIKDLQELFADLSKERLVHAAS